MYKKILPFDFNGSWNVTNEIDVKITKKLLEFFIRD